MHLIPTKVFSTFGVGHHEQQLTAFQLALKAAGIHRLNHICVSSILPPECEVLSRPNGVCLVPPGALTFGAYDKLSTMQLGVISAACGIAIPKDPKMYGYLSEHHSHEQSSIDAANYAADLAAQMLAAEYNLDYVIGLKGDERQEQFNRFQHIFTADSVVASAQVQTTDQYVCVFAGYIFSDYKIV